MRQSLDRCSGDCCRAFTLPYSLEEMRRLYLRDQASTMRLRAMTGQPHPMPETVKVYPLLITLSRERGTHPLGPVRQSGRMYWYSCKAFKDGQCTIYENRPKMCADYPQYGENRLCEYAGCTWEGQRGLRARGLRVYEEPAGCKVITGELLSKVSADEDVSKEAVA
jgi:Fe-S-cluster containining protein